MTRLLMILMLSVSLSACCAARMAGSSDTNRTDSVAVITRSETVRDTIVRIARDSATVRALLECDSVGRVRMARLLEYEAGKRMKPPRITVTDNVLTAAAEIDYMSIYLTLRDRLEQRVTAVSDSRRSETVIEVNRPTTWQRICCWTVSVAIGCMALFTVWKLLRITKI